MEVEPVEYEVFGGSTQRYEGSMLVSTLDQAEAFARTFIPAPVIQASNLLQGHRSHSPQSLFCCIASIDTSFDYSKTDL